MTGSCGRTSLAALAGWLVLPVVLVVSLPLFICMPVWADVSLHDLCARTILRGGVHYRDTFETNLPGMDWLQAAVRQHFGWRSETIRVFDFLVISAIAGLLVGGLRRLKCSVGRCLWTLIAIYAFYLGTPEICHCQRDIWALLPALVGLSFRYSQVTPATKERGWRVVGATSVLEGLVWGAAIWIKPFAVAPLLACWLLGILISRRSTPRSTPIGARSLDALGLFVGGAVAGILGLLWLWRSGAWPYFWEIMLRWNPEYSAHWFGSARLRRWLDWLVLYFPWSLALFLAVPVALKIIITYFRRNTTSRVSPVQVLLAGFSLSWLFQALLLQAPHEYVITSTLLPQIALLGASVPFRTWVAKAMLLVALCVNPNLKPNRIAMWKRCITQGSTAEIKDGLSQTDGVGRTDWRSLDCVARYLRSQDVHDGDIICFHDSTHPLYLELDVAPAVRFFHFSLVIIIIRSHRDEVLEELRATHARYIVSDLFFLEGMRNRNATCEPEVPTSLPASFPKEMRGLYPWNEPCVFRAGRYVVHRVTRTPDKFWADTSSP
jgi:hypothetical protein